ncbi:TPA: hypothetical protein OBS52_005106 [Escherichia coli]|nr:hypothetical protein [Escherichia coli]HCO6954178.1 hypothetical protein [Escherichia coli]
MNRIIILLFSFAISGCVNPYNYREEQDIIISFKTNSPPQEIQECILSEWQRVPLLYTITSQKIGKYYSVLAVADNADIYKSADGSTTIDFYSLRGVLDPTNGKNKWIQGIKSCISNK